MKITLSFLLLVLLSACTAKEQPATDIQMALVQEWGQFNPVTMNLASTQALTHFVLRSITERTADGVPYPEMAVSIPSVKDGNLKFIGSGKTRKVVATWKIRPEVVWGDNTPVTCKDWHLSWQVGLSDNVSTTEKTPYTKISKMEWSDKDPKTCTVTYSNDSWTFDRDLPTPIPSHIEAAIFEKWKNQKEAYDQNSMYVKDPTVAALYSGPYVISEFKLGSHIIMKANPNFWGKKPSIPQIVIRHIGDTNALRAQLQSKQINLISSVGFSPDLALELADANSKPGSPFQVRFKDSPIFQGMFWNHEHPILKDKLVREALQKGIDKNELVKSFFRGKIKAANTFLSPNNKAFSENPSVFNVNEARQLLDQAGWKMGTGKFRTKGAETLTLVFRTSAGVRVNEMIQTYICQQWERIGVECLIKNQPPRVFLGDSVPHGEFAIAMFGWPVLPDSSVRGQFSSKEIPSKSNSWTGNNSVRWKSKEMDELIEKFDAEWDSGKRVAIAREMDSLLRKEEVFCPIYHRREAVLMPANLKGFKDDVGGTGFLSPEDWTL